MTTRDPDPHPPVARRDRGVPRPPPDPRGHPGGHPARGRDPAGLLGVALRPHRCGGLAQGRGRQPDRLVQGPRDDRRDLRREARGRRGRRLRLDRQHVGLDGGLRRQGRPQAAGPRAGGQDRRRQDGPGDPARRPGDHGARQLRRLPRAWPRASPGTTRWRWSTRSTRSGSRARRPRPSRSSTSSATPPTTTCCRSATPATSRRTGSATRSTPTSASRPSKPVMRGFQAEGAAPLVTGEPFPDPETRATAIRIGNPASWKLAEAARNESGRPVRRPSATTRSSPPSASWPRATASSSSRPRRPGIAGLLQELARRRVLPREHASSITVTGHGLKDTATALEGFTESGGTHRRHGDRRRRDRGGRAPPVSPEARVPTFVDGPVRVSVPATSANLGPGFDSLGLALAMRDELEAEVVDRRPAGRGHGRGRRRRTPRRVPPRRPLDARGVRRDGRPAAGAAAVLHQRDPARPRPRVVLGRDRRRRRAGPRAGRRRSAARRRRGAVPARRRDRGAPRQRRPGRSTAAS